MYRLIALVLLLASCAAAPQPAALGPYRVATAPMYSNAVLVLPKLAGRWQQVASFGLAAQCMSGEADIRQTPRGLQVSYRLCLSGQDSRGTGPLHAIGPGRFAAPAQRSPWWVLWADADYRTLVIGTPDGSFGFILNRGSFPVDRLKAAREILDWNGYDLSKLVVY